MKKLILAASAIAALGSVQSAQAGEKGQAYGEIGATWYDVDSSAFGAVARLGYEFTENVALEAEGTVGVADDNGVGVNTSFAGFAVGKLPVGENSEVFARIGYHTTDFDVLGLSASFDDVAYGAGFKYGLNEKNAIRADYTRYEVSGGGLSTGSDTVTVTFARKF